MRRTVRRILLSVLLVALLVGVSGFYLLLQDRALRQAAAEARILLTAALAVRGYTTENILPRLARLPESEFHEESVPSFAAQAVFRGVAKGFPAYTYREPALNPTASADLATPFEVELIQRFRADASVPELTGVRTAQAERIFYLARPIRVEQEDCLRCHSTPDRAPPAMVARYGATAGFGWRLGEIVGVQVLTVSVTEALKGSLELVAALALGLVLVLGATYVALTLALDSLVVRPLQGLAEAAAVASQGGDTKQPLPRGGAGEIAALAEAVDRLRTSLGKALEQLRAPRPAPRPAEPVE